MAKDPKIQEVTEDMMRHNRAGQGEGGEVKRIKCKRCNGMFECARSSQAFYSRTCSRCSRKQRKETPIELR